MSRSITFVFPEKGLKSYLNLVYFRKTYKERNMWKRLKRRLKIKIDIQSLYIYEESVKIKKIGAQIFFFFVHIIF